MCPKSLGLFHDWTRGTASTQDSCRSCFKEERGHVGKWPHGNEHQSIHNFSKEAPSFLNMASMRSVGQNYALHAFKTKNRIFGGES